MDQALIPGLTLLISIGSVVFTQWKSHRADTREDQIEARTAAKQTVDILESLNEALQSQVIDLRARITAIEQRHLDCETQLHAAMLQNAALTVQLAQLSQGRGGPQ